MINNIEKDPLWLKITELMEENHQLKLQLKEKDILIALSRDRLLEVQILLHKATDESQNNNKEGL